MPTLLVELLQTLTLIIVSGFVGWAFGKSDGSTANKRRAIIATDDEDTAGVRQRVHELARKRFPELVR